MSKIALVYDRINKFGGAERILQSLTEIWPEAPIFTAVYNPKKAIWAKDVIVNSSFLRSVPFSASLHEIFPLLTPLAFESFNFNNYEIVISVTSSDAKGIVTNPGTCHICYCLTPTRYLWSGYNEYQEEPGFGFFNPVINFCHKYLAKSLRRWDYHASFRPDAYIAISKTVAYRIEKYYQKKAVVVYPPVDMQVFKPSQPVRHKGYFLIVSRLVPYKSIDYVISAFNKLGWKLIIIGKGLDEKRLKKIAQKNIQFIPGDLTDKKLCWYYQNCHALIFPGEEDFGLSAVEALSCARPVIALNKGGLREIIINNKTGQLYQTSDAVSLIDALYAFMKKKYMPDLCRQNAMRFDKQIFKNKFKQTVENIWSHWKERL